MQEACIVNMISITNVCLQIQKHFCHPSLHASFPVLYGLDCILYGHKNLTCFFSQLASFMWFWLFISSHLNPCSLGILCNSSKSTPVLQPDTLDQFSLQQRHHLLVKLLHQAVSLKSFMDQMGSHSRRSGYISGGGSPKGIIQVTRYLWPLSYSAIFKNESSMWMCKFVDQVTISQNCSVWYLTC